VNDALQTAKPTLTALIEAAERLFGSHGIENVSLRRVRVEAGASNNSAVSYYFKDRESLVRAIWNHRLPTLDAWRRVMLEKVKAQKLERDPHAVMRLLLMPNYELRDAAGVNRYAAFFRHALRWEHGTRIRQSLIQQTPASLEAMELFRCLAPDIPTELLFKRLLFGSCTFFDMIVARDADISAGRAVVDEAAFLAEGIDMSLAICLRPVTLVY
jgi:AcrR family transcriptional regulator